MAHQLTNRQWKQILLQKDSLGTDGGSGIPGFPYAYFKAGCHLSGLAVIHPLGIWKWLVLPSYDPRLNILCFLPRITYNRFSSHYF